MDDFGEEVRELKREIIESRGLIIKTNNLTNALAGDLKSIAKRQTSAERRAFLNSAVANALFVVAVILVVKFAWDARVESVEKASAAASARVGELKKDLEARQNAEAERAKAEEVAAAFYEIVRSGKDKDLIEAYESLGKDNLTRSEQAYFRDAVYEAKSRLSLASYHQGLEAMNTAHWADGVQAFLESLRYDGSAAHSPAARLRLAEGYRKLNRQKDAIPILTKLSEASADPEILDDALFLLAECLIEVQAWNDAKTALRSFIRRYPQSAFINDARMALADLSVKH
ncbi:MAG: tetratricopeptide repeat protein [Myxococcales bacterium]|nr:tetratricopeptide repeat protein [Myxococcales bacterium]